ncbi:MAG: hypothetical protein V3S22_04085 [Candidatus Neomarinimicrobiota bacterium]
MLNLKTFHIFFISLSILVLFGFLIWQLNHLESDFGLSLFLAGAGFISCIGLIFYLVKTIKKFKAIK